MKRPERPDFPEPRRVDKVDVLLPVVRGQWRMEPWTRTTRHSWQEHADRFVLFTTAAAHLLGGLDEAFLDDCSRNSNREIVVYHRLFPFPLFEGLEAPNGDRDWNHALMIARKEDWPFVEEIVTTIRVGDPDSGSVTRYELPTVSVPDPWVLEKRGSTADDVPEVPVRAATVHNVLFSTAWEGGQDRRQRLVFRKPNPLDVLAAEAYQRGHKWKEAKNQ